ncbi:MAG: FtsW/RodA/SpoVE family cell cycle protein [Candidatus Nanopelagicales bacterium]|nr:FtsW/RodA/SpoVE family cell cycle protein [Candidatus Nanopelagicales bacterium]
MAFQSVPTRQPTRRTTELLLTVGAWVLGILATLQIGWATGIGMTTEMWITVGIVGLVAVAMHVVIRTRAQYADPILLPVATLLTILGLVMIYRIDVASAQRAERNNAPAPTPDVYAQLTWFAVAAVLFIATLILISDHRRLQRFTYTFGFLGLVGLVLPLTPIVGSTINGATLWVRVFGLSFQPAEASKILLTIFFAGYLVVKRDSLALVRTKVLGVGFPRPKDVGPLLVAWVVSLGVLIFEHDLGTSLLFFGLFVLMLYIATQRRSWLILGAGLFIIGASVAYFAFGHVRVRVDIWWDPWGDANNTGYQLVQSLYGLASGGLFGSGLGQGYPEFVPFANTDFIVAAIGEELGLTGLCAMLLLFAILVERGLRTALAVRDSFGQLLAVGLSIVMALQVFVIIGGVTRLIPLTGLTTPFLSYGGSSLVANWVIIALLIRISDRARRPDVVVPSVDEALTQVVRRV